MADTGYRFSLPGHALLLLCLLWLSISYIFSSFGEGSRVLQGFLHLVNLPFHEAGHLFFSPFGDFMHSLGGSLGQCLMPLLCMVAFLRQSQGQFGAAVCLWWFGENLLDIAPYMDDARSLSLPLLGGNVGHASPYGFHDWEYLLSESGLLRFDHTLAVLTHVGGSMLMIAALGRMLFLLLRQRRLSASD